MRVAFFSTLTNSSWGGSEILWYKSALYMKAQGVEVTVYVKKWDKETIELKMLKKSGVKVHVYKEGLSRSFVKKIIERLKRLVFPIKSPFHVIIKSKPDFIYFSQSHSYDLGYFPEKSLEELINSKIPYSVICQNNTEYSYVPEENVRSKIRNIYVHAFRVFFVSNRNKITAENIICSKIDNAVVISNSMSLNSEEIGILPYPKDEVINFACVARLRCSHKGQNLLLHILSQPIWEQRNWVLNLYGRGEDENYLKELARFLNISHRVNFCGQVSEIKKIWEKNHILLLPSFGEGMPLALQEAMLLGRTCVVSDVGGNSELVENNTNGWVSDGMTLKAFGESMENAWAKLSQWKEMGIKAFKKAQFNVDMGPQDLLYKLVLRKLKHE